jgi:hypothetical protein
MSDLAGFRTLIRSYLGDREAVRYEDDMLDSGLRAVVKQYSEAYPDLRTGTVTVATAGREQSLVSLTRLMDVAEIDYPYVAAAISIARYKDWYFYWKDAVPYVYFNGNVVPAVGEVIRAVYYSAHTIEDLDGATASTVKLLHEHNLALGAAASVILQKVLEMAQGYGVKPKGDERLQKWGQDLQARFDQWLARIGSEKRYPGLPSEGWKVDDLDGEDDY